MFETVVSGVIFDRHDDFFLLSLLFISIRYYNAKPLGAFRRDLHAREE